MTLATHGDDKYKSSTLTGQTAEWSALRVKRGRIGSGTKNCVPAECTELLCILSGHARVKRVGDGQVQEGLAREGTSWLVPAGTHETLLELDGEVECLLIYLPARLLEESVLADYEISPDRPKLAYIGALGDPLQAQMGKALGRLMERPAEQVGGILVDGLRTMLAVHLIGSYSAQKWQPAARLPTLDRRRMQRVLDYVEAHLGSDITLEKLAREACLSPFHFARLFRHAIGLPPHRYVIERRIRAAQKMLAEDHLPLAQVALESGFGSQANFSRTFRKFTGMTPGQYRAESWQ